VHKNLTTKKFKGGIGMI